MSRQEDFKLDYSIKESLELVKTTRLFIFLQGLWEAIPFGVVPIYTLFFIQKPFDLGIYLSYLAFVSILANFLIGKFSDNIRKRTVFLYPITILITAVTILFPLSTNNLFLWIILSSFLQMLLPIFWNISTAFIIDSSVDLKKSIPGREIVLAVGRLLGLILAFLGFVLEPKPRLIFWILGAFMAFYPILLFVRTKITKSNSYM